MKARDPEKRRGAAVIALERTYARASAESGTALDRPALFAALSQHRLPDALAHSLADDAAKSGFTDAARALAHALERRMSAIPINYVHATAILLKGAPGAGKTTVAAKIAAQAQLTGRDAKIFAWDTIAKPIRALTDRLDVKVAPATNAQSAAKAAADAFHRKALAVIDTQGFNPRKAKARAAFAALGQIAHVQTIGVVSALSDAVETSELIAALDADRLIVTGLDLARRWGAVAVAATSGVPLAHVARSPFAGDGLEPLTPVFLAQILLGIRPNLQ